MSAQRATKNTTKSTKRKTKSATKRANAARSSGTKRAQRSSEPGTSHRWSASATARSNALDLDRDVFTWSDPHHIAESLKASADRSDRRKSDPYRSAMSMLTFYINRAGDNLSSSQRDVLERAKVELRRVFGRQPGQSPKQRQSRARKSR